VDEELKQLDLATAEARRLATAKLEALRAPQKALVDAASEYIGSVAARRLDAARHASVEVMAKFSDDDMAELRQWTEEQIALATDEIGREIESCDFWISEVAGLSPTDVTAYSSALMPKPKDTRTGIPQALVALFDGCLGPIRRGLAAVGLAVIPADAEPRTEVALARAWRNYRDAAVDCISRWADVDEHYHASAERFQEMRWELAGEVDTAALKARLEAEEAEPTEESVADQATRAAEAQGDAFARPDTETLVPVSG
jgi:hypothetical protein